MTDSITIQLTVTGVDGSPRVPLEINQNVSCAALRKLASEKTQIPLDKLRLIFRGRLVGSDESKEAVPEFKIEEGSVLHCMGKPAAAKAEPATATTSASAPSPAVNNSTAASATVRVGMNTGAANASAVQQDSLQQCLQRLRSGNSHADYLTGVTTLEKILSNIMNNPMEEKYRKMKQNNAAFQRRLGGLTGGDAVMKAAGFSVEDGVYVLTPSPEAWPKLTETKAAVDRAANEARAIANQTAPAPAAAPSLGGFPSDMAGNAAQQQMVANMMSNPQQLQAMLQVCEPCGAKYTISHGLTGSDGTKHDAKSS